MKQEFSNQWIGSRQPRKQRKFLANAPLNIKHKLLSANLSEKLKEKYKMKNFPLRKGDEVKIMRGEFKKKTGKINIVNLKKSLVSIEGIYRNKKDGTKISINFHPSNLQIQELELSDKKRVEALSRNMQEKKQETKTQEKPKITQSKDKPKKETIKNAH